jgi:hypothetical protein
MTQKSPDQVRCVVWIECWPHRRFKLGICVMLEIQCPCGSAHLRIKGEPFAQFWCHCSDCQRVHGAAYVAEAIYSAENVELSDGKTVVFSLKTTPRVSCAKCGTRLFVELAEIGMRGLNGYLLPSGIFTPTMHINCGEAVAPVLDDRPHYRTKPVAFGGDDVLMDWPINANGRSR